jgi:hypothetical protein
MRMTEVLLKTWREEKSVSSLLRGDLNCSNDNNRRKIEEIGSDDEENPNELTESNLLPSSDLFLAVDPVQPMEEKERS